MTATRRIHDWLAFLREDQMPTWSIRGMHAPQPTTVVERYSTIAQLFHWLTALLVVVAYIVSVGGPETRVYSPANDFSRGLHELLGISVFALTLMRVCWRA